MAEVKESSVGVQNAIRLDSGSVVLESALLSSHAKKALDHFLKPLFPEMNWEAEKVTLPRFVMIGKKVQDLMLFIQRILHENPEPMASPKEREPLDPEAIIAEGKKLADRIRSKKTQLMAVLTNYETFQFAEEEMARSIDLLDHLEENRDYFAQRVGPCTAFLPKNQPLYAFCCFVIVPALMSQEVNLRVPESMKHFFGEMVDLLEVPSQFPNVRIHEHTSREKFLEEVAPKTEVVIFTGTQENGVNVRANFPKEALFILNGSGHNPLIITETANIRDAVAATLNMGLSNQGQDCAAPNSFLVHRKVHQEFLRQLIEAIRKVKVGSYSDPQVQVGPLTDIQQLARLEARMILEREFIQKETPGVFRTKEGIMEPTVIDKPLRAGGNYEEVFAPLMVVQPYEDDEELARYLETEQYERRAMYVTVYGQSGYVDRRLSEGWRTHSPGTVLHNTHLHAPGVERGTQEYGGYGRGASFVSIGDSVIPQPTLPQREIHRFLVEPGLLAHQGQEKFYLAGHYREMLSRFVSPVPTNRLDSHDLEGRDWASFAADRVIERFPDEEVYTCAAGISPSGVVHFGNFRDVMITLAVAKELKAKGKRVRVLFSWDDYDRFRKVPTGLPDSFKGHIGLPLNRVPDPQGGLDSFARRNEKEFEDTLAVLGIEMIFLHQGELYPSGLYAQDIIEALRKKDQIAEILYSFMSGKDRRGEGGEKGDFETFKKKFWPITVYSPFSGKDNVTILSFDGESCLRCRCDDTGTEWDMDLTKDFNVKLVWKADWPMRWRHERVVFEPGGKDHATVAGSYDISAFVSKLVFNREPPVFAGYDFVGLQNVEGKMSSSAGNAMSPRQLLEIYTPELLLRIYEKAPPPRSFNLSFGTDIYRQYDEMDRENAEAHPEKKSALPFRQAVAFGQIVQWNLDRMKELLKGSGLEYDKHSIEERMPRARAWLEQYNPKEMIQLLEAPNRAYFDQMPEEARALIRKLTDYLKTDDLKDMEAINTAVYAIPKKEGASEAENRKAQKAFFRDVYQLLLGKSQGPRLSTYIWASDRETLVRLLDFS